MVKNFLLILDLTALWLKIFDLLLQTPKYKHSSLHIFTRIDTLHLLRHHITRIISHFIQFLTLLLL